MTVFRRNGKYCTNNKRKRKKYSFILSAELNRHHSGSPKTGGGRMVRWCWVNFQCRGVLQIWTRVGHGPTALAVGAGWVLFGPFFSLSYPFSSLSPSLWETARYRLKHCLKGPLNPKQPTNQITENIRRRKSLPRFNIKRR